MEFQVPELGEGIYEAELVEWKVKPGEAVKRGQTLAEVMTDKATMEMPSPFVGTISKLLVDEGKEIKVGQTVLSYEPSDTGGNGESVGTAKPSRSELPASSKPASADRPAEESATRVKAAPSVRRKARELGIDLEQIEGSGPGGRVLMKDVAEPARPSPSTDRRATAGKRIKLKGLRKKIAEHMVRAKQTAAHYSYIDECNVTELVRFRESLKPAFSDAGLKLTYMPFLVKAVVAALKEFPIVNASLDDEKQEIVLHDRYNIGFAVATPEGLIVPVIHDADQKDIPQLVREIGRLTGEARAGKCKVEDLIGGTFSITSIGGIGGLISTPVINHPEIAILGVGKIVRRPIYDDEENIVPADLMYLSFSFDHRVLDGAIGAEFANAIIRKLERPEPLLLPEQL